jgi:hypothetical protein
VEFLRAPDFRALDLLALLRPLDFFVVDFALDRFAVDRLVLDRLALDLLPADFFFAADFFAVAFFALDFAEVLRAVVFFFVAAAVFFLVLVRRAASFCRAASVLAGSRSIREVTRTCPDRRAVIVLAMSPA